MPAWSRHAVPGRRLPARRAGPAGRVHPWAGRLNAIPKYVFSSTLDSADWNNSTLVRSDAVAEVTRLKQQEGETC
ncbi:MAG TPA: hypothetical protein VN969_47150 [Streptosporangiaceae bacterium]|nr:hypothetical protein [Streptosporangiaceae bacterium]